jgi:ABC-type branched-subunit amino acid transport system ATPase component
MPAFRDRIEGTPPAIRRFFDRMAPKPRDRPVIVATDIDLTVAPPRAAEGPGLQIEHLGVRFGGVVAVDDVSIGAPIGTITGLIGPNGAGKTTLFNACSGLVRPGAGRVSFQGRDITRWSPAKRARLGLGRTFQRVQLFESLDVRTNINLARECTIAGARPLRHVFARRRDSRTIARAAVEAIRLTGIDDLVDLPVKDLSTGQRRLVELARALAGPFDVLLLDEPSSGLDQNETRRFGDILTQVVAERGIGILLVEHDMSLVRQICERVYVLDFGRVLFEGTAEEMVESEVVREAYLGAEGTAPEIIEAEAEVLARDPT